jgi:hypothetical protein
MFIMHTLITSDTYTQQLTHTFKNSQAYAHKLIDTLTKSHTLKNSQPYTEQLTDTHQITYTQKLKNVTHGLTTYIHKLTDTYSPNNIHSKTYKRNSRTQTHWLTDIHSHTHRHTLINSCHASIESCILDRRISVPQNYHTCRHTNLQQIPYQYFCPWPDSP